MFYQKVRYDHYDFVAWLKTVSLSSNVSLIMLFFQQNGKSFDQRPVIRSGIVFAEEQFRKGLEHFSDVLSVETIDSFKCDLNYHLMQVDENDEKGENKEKGRRVEAGDEEFGDDDGDDGGDGEDDGGDDDGEDDSGDGFDYDILRNVGLEIMGTVEEEDCQTGENFIILPPHLCQSTLGGRNGSSACTVISLITGCFINQNDRISLKESLPAFIGCIEAGNSLHEGPEFLLVDEAIQLLPFSATVNEERDCYKKDLETIVLQLFQNAKAIILNSNNSSVCLVKLSNQKVFLFDSHQHNNMGGLIAWTEKGFNDIAPFLPCRGSNDPIYIASILYD